MNYDSRRWTSKEKEDCSKAAAKKKAKEVKKTVKPESCFLRCVQASVQDIVQARARWGPAACRLTSSGLIYNIPPARCEAYRT